MIKCATIVRLFSDFISTTAYARDYIPQLRATGSRPEAIDSFRFQTAAIAGLQGAAGFVAPEVLRTNNGALMFEQEGVCGYLQTRIEGIPLHQAMLLPICFFELAALCPGLDSAALDLVSVPAAYRPVLWHVGCWSRLTELEQYLPCRTIADSVRVAMAEYVEFVEPQISNVAWQITDNDPSPFNVMITGQGMGFIRFWRWHTNELANCCPSFGASQSPMCGPSRCDPLHPDRSRL